MTSTIRPDGSTSDDQSETPQPPVANVVTPGPSRTDTPAPDAPAAPTRAKRLPPQNKPPVEIRKAATRTQFRRRHWFVILSFLIFVILPGATAGWYLWTRAADQYASTVGFSVRKENSTSAIELLGGINNLVGSSSSDMDVLYQFIQSQKLVSDLDKDLGLRQIWSIPTNDPVFAFDNSGTIEDLVNYWGRMVRIYYDSSTGLIELRVLAFRADDAQRIAQGIFDKSSTMINSLNDIAREDALKYSREELEQSVDRLKVARAAITSFRNRYQIVDPTTDVQSQAGLLGNLQSQLATALIDLDLLRGTTNSDDPRITQAERRIRVINERIAEERQKMGFGDGLVGGTAYAEIIGEFERLNVDQEFAERTYTSALATFDSAQAEARRKSLYLGAYVSPTLAERAEYPQRGILLGMICLFLFVIWAIGVLVFYAIRDRR